MYQVEAWSSLRRASRGGRLVSLRVAVGANVLALGLTSLLTDVSAEMVNTVLPAYVVLHLGLTPLAFGLLDGIAQGVTAIMHLAAGVAADRLRRYKQIAGAGYAVSAFAKLGLLVAGTSWAPIATLVAADRLGKGIRTVPRDLLISLSTRRTDLATAFGVHRGLDSAGAMIGPIVALGILSAAPRGFDIVFMTSFCVALCGVAALVLLVTNVSPAPSAAREAPLALIGSALRTPGIRRLIGAVLLLGAATIGDAFLYLVLQRQVGFSGGLLPLLYIGTAASYLVLSVPAGLAADAFGRERMFVAGYAMLACAYVVALSATGGVWLHVVAAVLLLGGYYSATDGVLMAIAGTLCPAPLRGSGMAAVTTATGVGRLFASVVFGAIWTLYGTTWALGVFLAALTVAMVCSDVLMRGLPDGADGEAA